jgi:hypothetical protein
MARPRKGEDYIMQRIADLFRYADGLPFSKLKQGEEWELRFLGTKPLLITSKRDIHCAIGLGLCDVEPNLRPYVLNRLADALRQKPRKSSPDEIALVREAWRKAKAGLKKNPTFKEADAEYHKLTGYHLNRRALRDAGCPIRPGKRGPERKIATATK